ncbi:peptide/nickel transport system permease protein [Sporobacter termitidis DSM 10068]|uniref:Peptide/nickel transport system permease protein n=1 Tax=Sporobacter termitidis DSM 10068 TaxID=1123282 RepID=A0A1M5WM30_9FIRM|nr:peptide/nickel transport system permease protein [Sporobacter termitidis DSM 10068]
MSTEKMAKRAGTKKTKMNAAMIWGAAIVGVFVLVAVLAPVLAPYDPYKMGIPYIKPSAEHLLGTNDVGQDLLSELIYGTRISLFIGIFTSIIVTVVSLTLSLLSGYYKGAIDKAVTAITNITMGLPDLALTILLIAYLNPGKLSVIISISLTAWTGTARILRSRVLQLCEMPFIKIEQAIGMNDFIIMIKHIVPNLKDIILSRAALSVSAAMMTEAGLSFLGLGDFGAKSWGTILHYAFYQNGVIRNYYWWYLPPILCTSLAVLGFMLLGYYGAQKAKLVKNA